MSKLLNMRVAVITVPLGQRSQIRNECIQDCQDQLKPNMSRGNFRVFVDSSQLGCAENSRRAWRWACEGDSEWAMVLADDSMGCRDLAVAIDMVFRCWPDSVHSMMDWTGWSQKAIEAKRQWISSKGNLYGGCMAMKRVDAIAMMDWLDERLGERPWVKNSDDAMVAAWCHHANKRVICSVPTIFQHMEPSESLIGNANKTRVCRHTLAPDQSIYDVVPFAPGQCIMSPNTRADRAWIKKVLGV